MTSYLPDVIDCLYDTYIEQRSRLKKYRYSEEEAFWIHFASVPFLPWFENDRNVVPVSHLIKFYGQIYNDEIMQGKNSSTDIFAMHLLQNKFNSAYALARQSFSRELNLKFALDIGTCVFPHIDDVYRLTLSGLVVMNTRPIYQRVKRRLSLGRLVLDINGEHYREETKRSEYAAVL
jgi:hypothetical protein